MGKHRLEREGETKMGNGPSSSFRIAPEKQRPSWGWSLGELEFELSVRAHAGAYVEGIGCRPHTSII